jgi:PPM family protein phosphatase
MKELETTIDRLFDRRPAVDVRGLTGWELVTAAGYRENLKGVSRKAVLYQHFDSLGQNADLGEGQETGNLTTVSSSITHVGLVRKNNEDTIYEGTTPDGGRLYAVADGMGGQKDGEKASSLAVAAVAGEVSGSSVVDEITVENAILVGDERVRAEVPGGATTFSGLYVAPGGHEAIIGQAGDSRIYLRRGKKIYVTRDQSWSFGLLDKICRSKPNLDACREVYCSNIVPSAIGGKKLEPQVQKLALKAGDTFLLCSDGLWEMVETKDIKEAMGRVAKGGDLEFECEKLLSLANHNGGKDNISVVMVRVEGEKMEPQRPQLLQKLVCLLQARSRQLGK